MKTPEEWVKEYERDRILPRHKRTPIHSNGQYVKAIQLDAQTGEREKGIAEGLGIAKQIFERHWPAQPATVNPSVFYDAVLAELTKRRKELEDKP